MKSPSDFHVMTVDEWHRFYSRMMAVYSVFYRRLCFTLKRLGPPLVGQFRLPPPPEGWQLPPLQSPAAVMFAKNLSKARV